MKIYLNGTEVEANILPTDIQTKDETLATLSFWLVSSESSPYYPMTKVKVLNDDDSENWYVLTADSVEPYTLINNQFKHSISCTEITRTLSKIMVRNSVFSQPADPYKYGTNILAVCAGMRQHVQDDTYYYEYYLTQYSLYTLGQPSSYLALDTGEKCAKAHLNIKVQVAVAPMGLYGNSTTATVDSSCHDVADINALIDSPSYIDDITSVELVKIRGGVQTEEILTASDFGGVFAFNEDLDCPKIAQYLNEGYQVYIRPVQQYMFSGKMYYTEGKHIPFISVFFDIKAETYRYTAYDILDLLLVRNRREHYTYPVAGQGTLVSNPDPFVLPSSGSLYDLLTNTIAPNFTFTQCTMYECVAEVFRLFDAIFTMDGDGVLGISKFNEKGSEVTPNLVGMNQAISEDRRTNSLIAYYQDARYVESFPSERGFAPSRSEDIGIPDQGDHHFIVPHPISQVIQSTIRVNFSLKVSSTSLHDIKIAINNYLLDITPYIVSQNLWVTLDTTSTLQTADPRARVQNNTVYFVEGDTKIQLGYSYQAAWGTTYHSFSNMLDCALWRALSFVNVSNTSENQVTTPSSGSYPTWSDIRMRATYIASTDGRMVIESPESKCRGEMIVDQANGAVDLGNLGANILGLSVKMGQPTLNANLKPFLWANRIKEGDYYIYQGSKWVANVCSYTYLGNGYYQGSVSFVKNYNELSLRKSVLREKRMSNISRSLIMKSEEHIIDYCYMSSKKEEITSLEYGSICFSQLSFKNLLASSFGYRQTDYRTLDFACIGIDASYCAYIPLIKYGAGNMVCFEMSFDDAMSAGVQTRSSVTGWFGSVGYMSDYIIYSNSSGFLHQVDVYMAYNYSGYFYENFPKIGRGGFTDCFHLGEYVVKKQPNEIFALNYEIAFLAVDPEMDIIGRAFIEDNRFVNNNVSRELYVYFGTEKYFQGDTKGKGNHIVVTSVNYDPLNLANDITFNHAEITLEYNAWSICDANGNILFASNRENGTSTSKVIYFKTRNSRL